VQIAFATHAGLTGLSPSDQLAADELGQRGVTVTPVAWSTWCDWQWFDAVVIRATWDYYTRPGDFLSWLQELEDEGVPLWNPAALARWNMNKGYLRDLARSGVNTVPTEWVSSSETSSSLERLAQSRGWSDVVVKPGISANANQTWRTNGSVTVEDESRFSELVSRGEVMVQPLIEELVLEGEWSFIFLGGEFSHAALKRPARGDFRVQSIYGGTAEPVEAPGQYLDQARSILKAVSWPWLYARVDGCFVDGSFMLIELEMLEPDLLLQLDGGAPAGFADSLLRLLPVSPQRARV
jgi:glutathione synthase/RimK-type ligase-like ATP-grasp enzyme